MFYLALLLSDVGVRASDLIMIMNQSLLCYATAT